MKKVLVGYVSGVHGLRGDLKVKTTFKDSKGFFMPNRNIYLNDEIHTITDSKLYKGNYLITIDNIRDINAVEHFKGYDVYIDRDTLELKDGEYILEDLPGLKVIYKGKEFGKVRSLVNNGVYYLLLIEYKSEYYIPLVDEYVKKVDVNSNTIEVDNIEGLIL